MCHDTHGVSGKSTTKRTLSKGQNVSAVETAGRLYQEGWNTGLAIEISCRAGSLICEADAYIEVPVGSCGLENLDLVALIDVSLDRLGGGVKREFEYGQ